MTYSAQFQINDAPWESFVDSSFWLNFAPTIRTFSGTVSSISAANSTISIQVKAQDDKRTLYDNFNLIIHSIFSISEDGDLKIESENPDITANLTTNGPKLAIFSYNTVIALDISNGEKKSWKLEGYPEDINHILKSTFYRSSSDRRLNEVNREEVTITIEDISKSFPITAFDSRKSINATSMDDQNAFIDREFSLSVKENFSYDQKDLLVYSLEVKDQPPDSRSWLTITNDGGLLSGVATHENDIGMYLVVITATLSLIHI